jgi:hypothetical protein
LPAAAFRLVVEEPRGWPWLLFAEVLASELDAASDERRLYDLGIVYERGPYIEDVRDVVTWFGDKAREGGSLIDAATVLINLELQNAFGPPGVPADYKRIVFVARQLGQLYRRLIKWSQDIRATRVDDDFKPVLNGLARFTEQGIRELGQWGADLKRGTMQALLETEHLEGTSGPKKEVNFTLNFVIDPELSQSVTNELDAAMRRRGYQM